MRTQQTPAQTPEARVQLPEVERTESPGERYRTEWRHPEPHTTPHLPGAGLPGNGRAWNGPPSTMELGRRRSR